MAEPRKMSNTEWIELSDAFGALVSILGPAKLTVTLHFILHFKDLRCDSMDPLVGHGETMFEVHAGNSTAAKGGTSLLAARMADKREEIRHHENHMEDSYCSINQYNDTLSRQLTEVEQVCEKFMCLAIHASTPGDTLFDTSEIKDCQSPGQHELRRDSTRPRREEDHH